MQSRGRVRLRRFLVQRHELIEISEVTKNWGLPGRDSLFSDWFFCLFVSIARMNWCSLYGLPGLLWLCYLLLNDFMLRRVLIQPQILRRVAGSEKCHGPKRCRALLLWKRYSGLKGCFKKDARLCKNEYKVALLWTKRSWKIREIKKKKSERCVHLQKQKMSMLEN